jgi:uncharacterized protein
VTRYKKPLPTPDLETREYWEGCRRHELLMQRCPDCRAYRFPPMPMCPYCNSMNKEWIRVSGRGKVYSWFVVHHATHPDFAHDVPYAVVLVELDEQADLRLPSNLVDCGIEDIHPRMPVELGFEDVTAEISLPKFRPLR